DFAERVMHPRYELERAYEAVVLGVPDPHDLDRLQRGIIIDGRRTLPATIRIRGTRGTGDRVETTLELVLREGRNRQVRRMCEGTGHPIERLKRIRLGSITGRGLRAGQLRDLTPAEIDSLVGSSDHPPTRRRPREAARRRRG